MKSLFLAILVLPWILFACNRAENMQSVKEEDQLAKNVNVVNESIPIQDTTKVNAITPIETEAEGSSISKLVDIDKKIVKNADVKLEVKSYANYSQKIKAIARKYGAYIAKEENFNTDQKAEAVIAIKVPVMYFEDLLNELPGADAKQLERNITTEEVTGQLVDTKARLLTKKETRGKYLEFLKQAKKVEDVLKVQSEINGLQEEIESAESRLTYLSGQTRYSTVNLNFFEPKPGYNYDDKPGFGNRVVVAFKNGGRLIIDLFVGLLYVWPLWLGIFILICAIKKWRPARLIKNR